jgi:transglutaminase/protease-like cytokinesis protein 3
MRILHKYCIFILLSSILSLDLDAQNFSQVDSVIDAYPKSFLNPKRLAERICLDFIDPSERVRAIYAWEAKNIEYDVKALYSKKKARGFKYRSQEEKIKKEIKFQNKLTSRTLRKKSAVCYGYAVLFK